MKLSPNGRTYRSDKEWSDLFSEYESSGLTKKEFCVEKSLNPQTFYTRFSKKKANEKQPVKFLEINPPEQQPAVSSICSQKVTVELSLPQGCTLKLSY